MKPIFIFGCMIAAAWVSYSGQPLAHHNTDVILVVITVFSVFAGFLVAILTILGDPALIPAGTWRAVENRKESIEGRIIWHAWLLVTYLLTIALLFAAALLSKEHAATSLALPKVEHAAFDWLTWLERAYLFVGAFSFLLSFALPFSLIQLQRARLDAELKKRRKEAGLE